MIPAKFSRPGLFLAALTLVSCSKPLKEPPGKILGTVILTPEPIAGENWAYVEASSEIASYMVTSDTLTHNFAFENLKVENLQTMYFLHAYREGYISYGDSILAEAGVTISNFNIVLQRGSRQDTSFQDGVSPNADYLGCKDTYISTPDSTAVHGSDPPIIIAGGSPDSLKRGLIDFSFNWLQYFPVIDTAAREIESAILRLYIDSVITYGSVRIAVFNLEQNFDENLASWTNNGPGPWPGGPGGTWGSLSSDTLSVGGATFGWVEFSIDRIADQWLLDSDAGPMMLKLVDETRSSAVYIRSADNNTTALHPVLRLVIKYLQ